MIESLAEHGVRPEDLVPSLMTTHTVANPEYDPLEAKKQQDERLTEHSNANGDHPSPDAEEDLANDAELASEKEDSLPAIGSPQPTKALSMPGVTTSLSSTDKDVVLDIRWTILCDLFLLLIADSVYDARSRVLLENVARYLSLEGLDVVKFEKRVTDALEIQESVEKMEQLEIIEGRAKAAKKKRYVMMGLATIGECRSIVSVMTFIQDLNRWWPRYRSFCRFTRSCYWSGTWSRLDYDRCDGDLRVSRRSGRCGRHYNWRCTHRFKYCGQGYGSTNKTSADFRLDAPAQ